MKTKGYTIALLCGVGAVLATARGATFYDFQSEQVDDFFDGGGVTGWSQTPANPSLAGTAPMAYISSSASDMTARLGIIGTLRVNQPAQITTTVSTDLATVATAPVVDSTFSISAAIIDDVGDSFTDQDKFSIALGSSAGAVATLFFSGNGSNWDVSYSVAGGSEVATTTSLPAGTNFNFQLAFTAIGGTFSYSEIGGGLSGTIATPSFSPSGDYGALDIAHIPKGVAAGNSSNALAFDNVIIDFVPEPSSSLLSIVAGGVFMARRRR